MKINLRGLELKYKAKILTTIYKALQTLDLARNIDNNNPNADLLDSVHQGRDASVSIQRADVTREAIEALTANLYVESFKGFNIRIDFSNEIINTVSVLENLDESQFTFDAMLSVTVPVSRIVEGYISVQEAMGVFSGLYTADAE